MNDSKNPAEIAAAAAQLRVNDCLDKNQNFRLEAGAGAGKTYSLVEALKRLIQERGPRLLRQNQKVACITYTKVARDEITNEIDQHPAIAVDTIHAFCWSFMSRFQSQLRLLLSDFDRYKDKIAEVGGLGARAVEYNLGFFGIEDDKVTLFHDDVPLLMAKLLDFKKFRQLFANEFPVLFIDEYQDTDQNFAAAISEHFFKTGEGPLVGLFGDHWQTIYRDDFVLAEFPNVEGIDKGANFRSVPAIVDVLNQLRPTLKQAVRDPAASGQARVYHTNDYAGERLSSRNGQNDLSAEVAHDHLEALRAILSNDGWDFSPSRTKILMLTHNVLAAEQGYPTLAAVFSNRKDAFAKKENKAIAFFADTVEPMFRAYESKRFGEMFQILGRIQAIRSHADKEAWRADMAKLADVRKNGTVGEVLDLLKKTRRPRLPDPVVRREAELLALDAEPADDEPTGVTTHRQLRAVPYREIVALTKFIEGSTPFATQHSVKGAEFENVVVVLGGGWNHYNWPVLIELLGTGALTAKNEKGYHRARNLFYVAVSRPKVRLAVLITQTMSDQALASLQNLFGDGEVHSLTL